jgi:hypothetical protein
VAFRAVALRVVEDSDEFFCGAPGPMDIMKLLLPLVAACSLVLGTSCTTMYDSYGRPVEVITPEGAALVAVAAGVVGYAIADKNQGRGHHRGHGYGHGGHGSGNIGYCR